MGEGEGIRWICDGKKAVDRYVTDLNVKLKGHLQIQVAEYLE